MERRSSCADSHFAFANEASSDEMDFGRNLSETYLKSQSLGLGHQSSYSAQTSCLPPFAYHDATMDHLPEQSFHSHQNYHSGYAHSNRSSLQRSSHGSVFSSRQPRGSIASTNTTWSHVSGISLEQQFIPQSESGSEGRPPIISPPLAPKRRHEPQLSQDREPFLTCVSRHRRSRRSLKEPRYQCTACGEGFQQKYDWKRHEETYQERTEMFECELCLNIYFLEKDFVHHHQGSHRCQVCVPKRHVELARKKRIARTGWGCGFCIHFSKNWQERCNHISEHFEKKGHTMDDWKHSKVIWSLLQRPEVLQEWCLLLETKQRTQNPFSWKESTTGRSEGYPDMDAQPQLQDLLEFFPPTHNAAIIARLAFETGLLDIEPAKAPPPVPEKDFLLQQPSQQPTIPHQHSTPASASVYNSMLHASAWEWLGSIPEDPFQPTNVATLDYDALNAAFNSAYGNSGIEEY